LNSGETWVVPALYVAVINKPFEHSFGETGVYELETGKFEEGAFSEAEDFLD